MRQKSGREMIFAVHAIEDASYYNRYAAWCDVEWFRYRRKSEAMHSLTGMTLGHKSGMYIQFLLRYSHWPCVCVCQRRTTTKKSCILFIRCFSHFVQIFSSSWLQPPLGRHTYTHTFWIVISRFMYFRFEKFDNGQARFVITCIHVCESYVLHASLFVESDAQLFR